MLWQIHTSFISDCKMRSGLCSVYIALILLACSFQDSICKPEEEEIPRTCHKYVIDFVLSVANSTLKCLAGRSTFKMNNILELGTRASCLLKCTLQEEGIIAFDGNFDDIGAALYFEETFPQEVREIALPEAQPCFELAAQFNTKEYWCKTYLPFIECALRAIIKGLIPYAGACLSNPVIGILFSVIKYIAPDSPAVSESAEEMKRAMGKRPQFTCLDRNCTRLYESKKVNGTQTVILYNQNMEVISVKTKDKKPKSRQSN